MALPNVMCVDFLYFRSCMLKISWLLKKKRMFFVWKTRWTIPQESFLLNKSYFLFSWLTHFIRDEWVEFDSQTTVWPNVSAVIAITIRVCDFIKLLFALMYKCVFGVSKEIFIVIQLFYNHWNDCGGFRFPYNCGLPAS